MSLDTSFEDLWSSLAPIGYHAGTGGYRRYAWSEADLASRAWFVEQASARSLAVETDRNANLWAWRGTPGPGAVVTGSHLDSVPDGGAFDGPLGVVSALCALDQLDERGVELQRPVAVVAFSDEEGARFGMACVGSRLMTGVLDPERARALRDVDGVTMAAAMTAAGADPSTLGRDDEALERIGCFVELHCEQGRGLVDLGAAVGVASAIWPHGRWRCTFHGEANHAGTTRLEDRRDPVVAFARTVLDTRRAAEDHQALATFGRVVVEPNATNAVAAVVHAWLDARAPDQATLDAIVAEITNGIDVTAESVTPEVVFAKALRERLCAVLGGAPALPTGAGHDAGILSAVVPTAMLFVRNPTGVSHSPAEHVERGDCLAGIDALATVLANLAA